MRTKNAKRLWPVPATLAVMAVAAFLAFGLMATTGAQPAAAQDDPDCTAGVGDSVAPLLLADNAVDDADDLDCSVHASPAVIAIQGHLSEDEMNDVTAWVYAKGGTIQGGATLTDVWDHNAVEGNVDVVTSSPTTTTHPDAQCHHFQRYQAGNRPRI